VQPKDISTVAWDIGGANVKVAFAKNNQIYQVQQHLCPLWKGLDVLDDIIDKILTSEKLQDAIHVVTMTGELVDLFDDRKQGVQTIIGKLSSKLSVSNTKYFAGELGFLETNLAIDKYEKVASANWLATAIYVAKKSKDAILIDIGSTTTDIIPVQNHKVVNDGYSDVQRLIAKELETNIFQIWRIYSALQANWPNMRM